MAAPSLIDVQSANYTDTGTTDSTPSITWLTGDLILVIGVTEDNSTTLNVPSAGALSFSQVTATNTSSNGKVYAWVATAASGGSSAVTTTRLAGSTGHGITAFVYRGSTGIGNTALLASTGTTNATQALTRAGNNSAVVVGMADWSAINDTTVAANPSTGGTVQSIQNMSGVYTSYVASWTDQGAAGTTSYGINNYTATAKWIGLVVEVQGTASGAAATSLVVPGTVRLPVLLQL